MSGRKPRSPLVGKCLMGKGGCRAGHCWGPCVHALVPLHSQGSHTRSRWGWGLCWCRPAGDSAWCNELRVERGVCLPGRGLGAGGVVRDLQGKTPGRRPCLPGAPGSDPAVVSGVPEVAQWGLEAPAPEAGLGPSPQTRPLCCPGPAAVHVPGALLMASGTLQWHQSFPGAHL